MKLKLAALSVGLVLAGGASAGAVYTCTGGNTIDGARVISATRDLIWVECRVHREDGWRVGRCARPGNLRAMLISRACSGHLVGDLAARMAAPPVKRNAR